MDDKLKYIPCNNSIENQVRYYLIFKLETTQWLIKSDFAKNYFQWTELSKVKSNQRQRWLRNYSAIIELNVWWNRLKDQLVTEWNSNINLGKTQFNKSNPNQTHGGKSVF
jgi:hypothetical protein